MLYMAHDTFLCNQMFPFANVIAFAKRNNQTVIYPDFAKHADNFPFFTNNELCQFPTGGKVNNFWALLARNRSLKKWLLRTNHIFRLFPHIHMSPEHSYDFESESNRDNNRRILSAPVAVLDGLYLLSDENFIREKDMIKNVFAPTTAIMRNVNDCIDRVRENADIVIGTHMRFGDYLTFKKSMAYEVSEYYEVMQQFVKLFGNKRVAFVLCSDKQLNVSDFPNVRASNSPGHYVEDLYCLSRCDLIIGPPSTFSQWASFYGDVPRYAINYKNELLHGLTVTEPHMEAFFVHCSGFGKHGKHKQFLFGKGNVL